MFQHLKERPKQAVCRAEARRKRGGFTLIEVIAVTIILGVLASMVIPSIHGAGSKARNAKLKNDLITIDQAIAVYKLENGHLPETLQALTPHYLKNAAMLDAKNQEIKYQRDGDTYTLTGSDAEGADMTPEKVLGAKASQETPSDSGNSGTGGA